MDDIGNALLQVQSELQDLRDKISDSDSETKARIQRVIEALGSALDALREVPLD